MTSLQRLSGLGTLLGLALAVRSIAGELPSRTIDLSGAWRFRVGPPETASTIAGMFFGESIVLPGSMAERGKGDDISAATAWTGLIVDSSWFTDPAYEQFRKTGSVRVPFWLNPRKTYVGQAWYRRTVEIPPAWDNRRITLFLERCHWETTVWVDGVRAGMRNSLGTPHEYDLTSLLPAGRHVLTICVDNRIKDVDVGSNASSVTDHTQTNWNGIVGRIELQVREKLWLDDVKVFPEVGTRSARVRVTLGNTTGRRQSAVLDVTSRAAGGGLSMARRSLPVSIADSAGAIEFVLPQGAGSPLWDEFKPALHTLVATLRTVTGKTLDRKDVQWGLREFVPSGTRCAVNGRPVFLRGTLEAAIFPLTGYPPTDRRPWERIFKICRAYGLNHMRFHSWCPPEAAFDAADRMGFYLQVECGVWRTVGDGKPVDAWLYEESKRIVHAYGNHPSFCMMAAGNEPGGRNSERFLGEFVRYWRRNDSRRVYASAAGWPAIPENQYHVLYGPRIQMWDQGLQSVINRDPPNSLFDYRSQIERFVAPVVSHEVGQWCAYPNFSEIPNYTGMLRPGNLEIFRSTLVAAGLGHLQRDFLRASGKLQTLCYQADIEALLRTPGLAGFQLLDLHDFPGQGTAPVGVLNAFWDQKGYVTPAEYRRFCSETVPLIRLPRFVYDDAETLRAVVEVAHFGPAALAGVRPAWRITDAGRRVVLSGFLERTDIPTGGSRKLGTIAASLHGTGAPAKLVLSVSVGRFENSKDLWVYPQHVPVAAGPGIMITREFDSAAAGFLANGGSVLLSLGKGTVRPDKGGNVAVGFSNIFWNTSWTRRQAPHTLGILCNPRHPAFAEFPTGFCSNWQWWGILKDAQAVRLDAFERKLVPIVRIIDDWNTNRSLALLVELRIGRGRLLVCGADLPGRAPQDLSARQLLHGLLTYMRSADFRPQVTADVMAIRNLLQNAHD